MTTHYSAADLKKLIKSANKVCGKKARIRTEFLRSNYKKSIAQNSRKE